MPARDSYNIRSAEKNATLRRQKYAGKGESVEKLVSAERNVAQNRFHILFSQNQTVFLLPGFEIGCSQRSERLPDQRQNFFREFFCGCLGKLLGILVFAPPFYTEFEVLDEYAEL